MMSTFDDVSLGAVVVLKPLTGILIFGFLIYSMFFTGHYELTFGKGIVAFILLLLFSGFVSMIPFGTTASPILFEWWWHDIAFWDFTTPAWTIALITLVVNIWLIFVIAKTSDG